MNNAPLAARIRPRRADQYIGQQHIMGEGAPLRKALDSGQAHSMILWGPPGTGKTTLAELVAQHCNAEVQRLSAVTSGVKDIREAVAAAKQNTGLLAQQTVLFVDEVHRFNKAQQDAFLPFIEDGTIIFIGATTENPSFELNRALLSRTRVYTLKKLEKADLFQVLERGLQALQQDPQQQGLTMADDAKTLLVELAGGDARRLLNYLELASHQAPGMALSCELVKQVSGEKVAQYDKGGDHYYDLISAFHKSVRGSSPDAALYWYSRILVAGGDPLYVARRLLAIASEDIGNADPRALQVCLNAWDIFHRVGPTEGERAIAQAAVYCASAAKSNAVYTAFAAAKQLAEAMSDLDVPLHLRNAPTGLLKELGHGADYRYAHNEANAYAAGECYLPEAIKETVLYQPTDRGLEKKIQAKLQYLQELDNASPHKRYE